MRLLLPYLERRGWDIRSEVKYDAKMLAKLALIFFGLLFLVCVWLGRRETVREAPEGEKIMTEDAVILLQALELTDLDFSPLQTDTEFLTYGQYIEIRRMIGGEEMGLPDYADRYEEEHPLLKEDWYTAYRFMLGHLDRESSIWETTVFLLKVDGENKEAYTENGGAKTVYRYHSSVFEKNVLQRLSVYVKGSDLLTVARVLPEEYELKNVWIMESTGGELECFYHQVTFPVSTDKPVERERIADLTFKEGTVVDALEKNEKVHGRLLRMTEEELEIEGCGVYKIAEGMEVYKLYGSLESKARSDLRIGYADTDFVLERGQVCAGLISGEETADRIRVLLKNTAKSSSYHDEVELTVDGETIQVKADEMEVGERRTFFCAALTDKILLRTEGRTRGDGAYRGTIECYRTKDGMAVINELPLEEYLYAVVPSEMPPTYPLEALKSQAVCARTYAYRYILHAGLPEVGAHLDDTTGYQVYHNVSENAASTTAVKETSGVLLVHEGEPAQNYYYSTSCGVGTDTGIWRSGDTQGLSYLQAVRLRWADDAAVETAGSVQAAGQTSGSGDAQEPGKADSSGEMQSPDGVGSGETLETPEALREEENFYRFITSVGEKDLEKEEPWYRWTYTVEELDTETLLARMQARYTASPASVLTRTEGEYFVSQPVEKFKKIKEISIVKRGAGGVAEELLIETDAGGYKILAEYNIRSVLCDGVSGTVLQDGSTFASGSLLPSGFFVIETGKKEGNVVGYTLTGGGYGHGVGMSQNGARELGREGVTYDRILEFFFPGCELDNIEYL